MKNYYRVMLGRGSDHAAEAVAGGFIGADYGIAQDLTGQLPDEWRAFNRKFIPIYLAQRPEKTKIGAGLACGAVWTVAKGINRGDIVLSPDGAGHYHVGEVSGGYQYHPGGILPHRRPVQWLPQAIDRGDMGAALRKSAGLPGAIRKLTNYQDEIESLLRGVAGPTIIVTDETVEDVAAFAIEKHLEEFLVENWAQTSLGREYDIYAEEGERVGQQYPTDTGPIDILAVSKDKRTLLVVELKKGRASDTVVGQVLRYMGYVREELAEKRQKVRGVIIAQEDDVRVRRALAMVPEIEFYRYQISFKLSKA
ncbi:MAG: DUF1016 family protein [Anaerolineales bacterium]|nr:DUF1016 family protein [Anaerolineales bacterium]